MAQKDTKKPTWAASPTVTPPSKKKVAKRAKTAPVAASSQPSATKPQWAQSRPKPRPAKIKADNILYFDLETMSPNAFAESMITYGSRAAGTKTTELQTTDLTAALEAYAKLNLPSDKLNVKISPSPSLGPNGYGVSGSKPTTVTSGYLHVLPDSHRWHELQHLINCLETFQPSRTKDYLLTGLRNTQADGFQLVKLGLDTPGPGTFWKRRVTMEVSSVPVTEAEFKAIMLDKTPKELWCNPWSTQQPLFILNWRNFKAGTNPSLELICATWTNKTPKRMTLKALYKLIRLDGGLTSFTYR